MKIAVWVNDPIDKHSGGSYNYANTLVSGIDNFSFNRDMEIVFISLNQLSNFNNPTLDLKRHQRGVTLFVKVIRRALKMISKEVFKGAINAIDQREKRLKDASATAFLKDQDVGIIFYPLPSSQVIDGIPFILNNWDLAHYTIPEFSEITGDNGFNKRNDWYVKVVPDALMVLTETETGKKELVQYLNLDADKIKVLPIFSSDALTKIKLSKEAQAAILKQLSLEEQQFFFYPAQFWEHKNHINLVKAFKKFVQQYPGFKLFFCGSDKGNLPGVKNYVRDVGLEGSVIFGGFIEDEALYTLYKNARALVMPTFLGPSNIPPLEAVHLQCPVLLSDLEGHKEMMNDAALYFDPSDDLSILESMKSIMNDSTRLQVLQNQKEFAKITQHTIQNALIKLNEHFVEAIKVRSGWE